MKHCLIYIYFKAITELYYNGLVSYDRFLALRSPIDGYLKEYRLKWWGR